MIIGLTGYSGTGKNSAGDFLQREFKFHQVAFANKIRELSYNINPHLGRNDYGISSYLVGMVDELGWERAKREIKEVREFLQSVGEGARQTFGDTFWIDQVFTPELFENNKDIVVTDVRYENESNHITAIGGYIVRIVREGCGPINNHITEQELTCDYIVANVTDEKSVLENRLRELIRGLRNLENYNQKKYVIPGTPTPS